MKKVSKGLVVSKGSLVEGLSTADLERLAFNAFRLLDVQDTTRRDYEYRIGLFFKFIGENGWSRDSFLEYKRYLAGRTDWSISTKNKYLTTAKIFLREAHRNGPLPVDITLNVKLFNQGAKHKRDGLNDAEVQKLADALRLMPDTPRNTRLKAIFSLLIFQGLRQIEIIRLDVRDLDFSSQVAFVQGKGRDDKDPVDLHPEAVRALRSYLKTNRIADGALFVSQGNRGHGKRLTTRTIRRLVKDELGILSIEKTTHGLRHYFATTLIKTYKGELLSVARYTRHRGIGMLQVYNDEVNQKADLPKFYSAFGGVRLSGIGV